MSFENYEWYGWIVLFLAISSTLTLVAQLAAINGNETVNGRRTVEIQTGATALLIVLSIWMALP